MHCFSGDADFARACLDRGAHLSFAGTVTFKNAANAARGARRSRRSTGSWSRPTRRTSPRCRYRGRPNASYLVPHTVRAMADVRGDDLETLCAAIDANTERAFGGAW